MVWLADKVDAAKVYATIPERFFTEREAVRARVGGDYTRSSRAYGRVNYLLHEN